MTVIVVLHLTIDWHHSEWLGTVYDYDYNRTDPTHTDNHYDYDRMVLVYRIYHSLITTRFFAFSHNYDPPLAGRGSIFCDSVQCIFWLLNR